MDLYFLFLSIQELQKENEIVENLKSKQHEKIILNIGGNKFTTSRETLCKDKNSMLCSMFCGRHNIIKDSDNSVFIDRDGTHFRHILNYLRGNIENLSDLPSNENTLKELAKEADYYQLLGLKGIIATHTVTPANIKKIVIQDDLKECRVEATGNGRFDTVKEIYLDNAILNDLTFQYTNFKHFADFTNSSLVGTSFYGCYFMENVDICFDNADVENCNFEWCGGASSEDGTLDYNKFIEMIKNKTITFKHTRNIDKALFDNKKIKRIIKRMYKL